MTEEIIIDGKDVSEWELKGVLIPITECKYFEGIGGCKEAGGLCVTNDNCYYKQLKRLEQENEKLRYKIQKVVQANDRIVAECTEIMKPKCETSMISELMKENETLTKESENRNNWITSLNKKCEELIKEKLNYRSALEEIRATLNKECGIISNAKVVGIINEVLGND